MKPELCPPLVSCSAPDLDVAGLQALVRRHAAALVLFSARKLTWSCLRLQHHLPRVRLLFAVRPLPQAEVLAALDGVGACFVVASADELARLAARAVAPDRIFCAGPGPAAADVARVRAYGVRTFVVGSLAELGPLEACRESCEVVLRLAFDDFDPADEAAAGPGETAETAGAEAALALLAQVQAAGFRVAGLSLAGGAPAGGPAGFVGAIAFAADLFAQARQVLGLRLRVLHLGGGFPDFDGAARQSRADFCAPLTAALDRHFPAPAGRGGAGRAGAGGVEIYAEPGQSVVGAGLDVVTQVVGKAERAGRLWYYLHEGVCRAFGGGLLEPRRAEFEVLAARRQRPARLSVFAGPTREAPHVLRRDVLVPELEPGDLLRLRHLGAFTAAGTPDFNPARPPVFVPVG